MTLIGTRSAVDRKSVIGRVSVLMWIDAFYFVQFAMCLVAAVEGAYVRACPPAIPPCFHPGSPPTPPALHRCGLAELSTKSECSLRWSDRKSVV